MVLEHELNLGVVVAAWDRNDLEAIRAFHDFPDLLPGMTKLRLAAPIRKVQIRRCACTVEDPADEFVVVAHTSGYSNANRRRWSSFGLIGAKVPPHRRPQHQHNGLCSA